MTNFVTRVAGRIGGAMLMPLLGLRDEEVTLARRGFSARNDGAREHLETVGRAFLGGYHAALKSCDMAELADRLQENAGLYRGFAYEGAAMALGLLDHLFPLGASRWRRFLQGPGRAHCYMLYVGYGWAAARLPWVRGNLDRGLSRHDPLLRWLIVDGYGFHEGYFYWRRYVEDQVRPRQLSPYAQRAFDQGLGRSLWFMSATDTARIVELLARFDASRLPDLWSGIGLACAYAGIVDEDGVKAVSDAAGPYRENLAQGAAFAAKARQLAGNPAEHTELACREFCHGGADAAARACDDELIGLPPDEPERPAYEAWRVGLQNRIGRLNEVAT